MIAHLICAFKMVEKGNLGGWGYSSSMLICSSGSGSGAEKNVSINALVFSLFDAATVAGPTSCFPRFSVGSQVLPPLVGVPDAYQCAVQIVLSSIDCRKSSQCALFAVLIIIPYEFLAAL